MFGVGGCSWRGRTLGGIEWSVISDYHNIICKIVLHKGIHERLKRHYRGCCKRSRVSVLWDYDVILFWHSHLEIRRAIWLRSGVLRDILVDICWSSTYHQNAFLRGIVLIVICSTLINSFLSSDPKSAAEATRKFSTYSREYEGWFGCFFAGISGTSDKC